MSADSLLSLTAHVPLVVLGVGSDCAGSCGRLKMRVGQKVVETNENTTFGHALLLSGDCVTHILHREAEHCGVDALIRKMYNTAWLFSLTDVYTKVAWVVVFVILGIIFVVFGVHNSQGCFQYRCRTCQFVTPLQI